MIGLLTLLGTALVLLLLVTAALIAREMVRPTRRAAGWAIARGLPCDPADAGYEYEQWWLDRPSGVRLPVWEVVTEPSADAGVDPPPTVVFVHGWGQSRVDMLGRMMPAWIDRASRFVLYDQRGHGESIGAGSNLGDGEVDDLLALLDQLGDGPVVLVGYSMGAVVAIAALVQDKAARSRVAGVAAYAPYADFHESLRARLRELRLPRRPVSDLALLMHRVMGVRPRDLRAEPLDRIDVPVAVLHGANDTISPIEHGRLIAERIADATLHEVAAVGHDLDALLRCDQHEPAIDELLSRIEQRLGRRAKHRV